MQYPVPMVCGLSQGMAIFPGIQLQYAQVVNCFSNPDLSLKT